MKLRIIFNPHSGRRRHTARLQPLLREFISARRLDAELIATEGPGHATQLAREAAAAGCLRVVAVGGDGTMNEVAQALLQTPSALGLVPCGSGNGLARHLQLPASSLRALELATDPEASITAIDTGTVNGRPFFNAMGIGLDADVSYRFNHLVRRGLPAYGRTLLAAYASRSVQRCTITDGARRETLDALLVAVANSDQYGNGALIAPRARANDGILDLVAIRPVRLPGAAILIARLFLGTLDRSPRVLRWRGCSFEISRPAPGRIHTDGEPYTDGTNLEIAIAPASLRVVASPKFQAVVPFPQQKSSTFALQLP